VVIERQLDLGRVLIRERASGALRAVGLKSLRPLSSADVPSRPRSRETVRDTHQGEINTPASIHSAAARPRDAAVYGRRSQAVSQDDAQDLIEADCVRAPRRHKVRRRCAGAVGGWCTAASRVPPSWSTNYSIVRTRSPFASLSYELDRARAFRPRPQRNQPAKDKSIGTVALLREGGSCPIGRQGSHPGRTGRARPRFGADPFPDLQKKKPVWLEKLDVATSPISIKRPDGSVDLVTFGEPTSTGAGQAVDVAAPAPVGSGEADLPAFVRQAIRRARRPGRSGRGGATDRVGHPTRVRAGRVFAAAAGG
jgi:hypothetical protein